MNAIAAAEVVRDAVRATTGDDVTSVAIVHGGDTSAAFRVATHGGRTLFAKTHPSPPAGFFTTEAASLAWLGECDAVRVPTVVAVSDGADGRDGYLVLEWIEQGSAAPDERRSVGAWPRCTPWAHQRSVAPIGAPPAVSVSRTSRPPRGRSSSQPAGSNRLFSLNWGAGLG